MNDITSQEALLQSLEAADPERIRILLTALHPSEIADLLESLPAKHRESIWDLIDPEHEGDVLSHAEDAVRAGLLEQMLPGEVAEATKDLDTDDAADILQDLPEDVIDSVLLSMDAQNRERLASILFYAEDTAGGLMNTDVVPIRADVNIDVVSRYLRKLGKLPDQTDTLMVIDRANKYLGYLPLSTILTCKPDLTVGETMTEDRGIPADMPDHNVAILFEQRDFFTAAVVDTEGKLLGRITVDDVLDVIQEEARSTVLSMAGLSDHDMFAPVFTSARSRAVWLGINLITALLASWVIGRFAETIQQLVALAVLMPIVASMGGIAGSQTLTITIRGLALGQISRANANLLLHREATVGLLNGLLWACVVAMVAGLWFQDFPLGLIIGLAMITNLIFAAIAGTLIPLYLKRAGIDPALAGGVILTTVTDVTGFVTFLGLATVFLVS
jgi:magnesium transporter